MLRIDCKSPDRVGVLLALDALNAATVLEQSDKFSNYSIWCDGVAEWTLRDRLAVACQHPFEISRDEPPIVGKSGGAM